MLKVIFEFTQKVACAIFTSVWYLQYLLRENGVRVNSICLKKNITLLKFWRTSKMWFSSSKSLSVFYSALTFLCVIIFCRFDNCVSQRNPPQGASRSNSGSNLYTYGRGDIPMFNPGDPHGPLLAALRELIIAIQ